MKNQINLNRYGISAHFLYTKSMDYPPCASTHTVYLFSLWQQSPNACLNRHDDAIYDLLKSKFMVQNTMSCNRVFPDHKSMTQLFKDYIETFNRYIWKLNDIILTKL